MLGDYNDKYGHAWFDGFTGTYTDKHLDPNTTENSFTGTWGYKHDDRTNGGTWDSTATCTKDMPKGAATKSGVTSNATVEAMLTGPGWGAWSVEVGDTKYLVGGCIPGGMDATCEARLYAKTGKLEKTLNATIPDADPPNLTDVNKMKVALDKLLDGNSGNKLVEHALTAAPVTYENITMKWDAKARVLSVFDGKKLWKKVAGPKLGKGMQLSGATVSLFEAGSPPAAVLEVDSSEIEGISTTRDIVVFPLPAVSGGD